MKKNYNIKLFETHQDYINYVFGQNVINFIVEGETDEMTYNESNNITIGEILYYGYDTEYGEPLYFTTHFTNGTYENQMIYTYTGTDMEADVECTVNVPENDDVYTEPHTSYCKDIKCVQYNKKGNVLITGLWNIDEDYFDVYSSGNKLLCRVKKLSYSEEEGNKWSSKWITMPSDGILFFSGDGNAIKVNGEDRMFEETDEQGRKKFSNLQPNCIMVYESFD